MGIILCVILCDILCDLPEPHDTRICTYGRGSHFSKVPLLTGCGKVPQFALFNKSRPVFFSQLFVLMEGVLIFPKLPKLSLVAPPSKRY
jgi:hypothetical protein